jgi:hypothetical protein
MIELRIFVRADKPLAVFDRLAFTSPMQKV